MPKNQSEEARANDIAIRKKKNADAQAAFRARRATYISTLEETVTSLESVVLQLQDSCRDARAEAHEFRRQIASMRHEFTEREKYWRTLWQSRKTGENDDIPPLPQPMMTGHLGSPHVHGYNHDALYRSADDAAMCNGGYGPGPSHHYTHSPSMGYAAGSEVASESQAPLSARGAKFGSYGYALHGSHRDSWAHQNAASSSGESGQPASTTSSNSPSFGESPTLTTSDLGSGAFPPRFGEDQKVPVASLEGSAYVFPASRPISPNGLPAASSSSSLTAPFHFAFADGVDRGEYDYRRHPSSAGVEVSLSGPGSDAMRFKLGNRRPGSGGDRPMLPLLPPLSMGDPQDHGSSDGDCSSYGPPRLRQRRESPARSISPTVPPMSGTLAVIKAQAFGALRRTRARSKKSTDAPAKTVMDVMESRGIGVAPSSAKRQRTEESDEQDMTS